LPYTDIWAENSDGSGAHPVVTHGTNESLFEPAWSPDGKEIYFAVQTSVVESTTDLTAGSPETWRIDRVGAAGGARSTIATDAQMPDVSSAGDKLVYVALEPNNDANAVTASKEKLVVSDLDGSGAKTIVDASKYQSLYGPTVSPDGRWVAFAAIAPIATVPTGFDFLRWLISPETAYAHGLPWELFLVSTLGGEPVQLTHLNEDQPHAAWLDGTHLAFNGATGLYKVQVSEQGALVAEPEKVHEGAPHGGLTWHAP
jgi:Tol biopolymer transport system component